MGPICQKEHDEHLTVLRGAHAGGPFPLASINPQSGFVSMNVFHLGPRHPAGHCCALEPWHPDPNAKQIACLSKL